MVYLCIVGTVISPHILLKMLEVSWPWWEMPEKKIRGGESP